MYLIVYTLNIYKLLSLFLFHKKLGETAAYSHRPRQDVQDFETIRQQCLNSGSLFEDPLFPASNESLMFSRRPDRYIEWLRPHVSLWLKYILCTSYINSMYYMFFTL